MHQVTLWYTTDLLKVRPIFLEVFHILQNQVTMNKTILGGKVLILVNTVLKRVSPAKVLKYTAQKFNQAVSILISIVFVSLQKYWNKTCKKILKALLTCTTSNYISDLHARCWIKKIFLILCSYFNWRVEQIRISVCIYI